MERHKSPVAESGVYWDDRGQVIGMRKPILGVLAAIAVTTLLDANDLSVFSALPLAPLMFWFWWW